MSQRDTKDTENVIARERSDRSNLLSAVKRLLRYARNDKKGYFQVKSKGFTIIEIIIVLTILGVLAATAAPRFADLISSTSPFSIDAAANMIESDIRYVQELAMATHQDRTINFGQVFLENPQDIESNYYLLYVGSSERRYLRGVTLGNTFPVTFNSFGEPTAGGGQALSVGGTKTVSITAYTGKVSVQ